MPAGQDRVVGRPLGLDAARADTDGDGLDDDEEVTMGHGIEGSHIEGTWKLRAEVEDAVSHPSMVITSGGALTDREELQRGTNPLIPQRLKAGLLVSTAAEVTDGEPVPIKDRALEDDNFDSYLLGIEDSSQIWEPNQDKNERTTEILTDRLPTVGPPDWMNDDYNYQSDKLYMRISSKVVAEGDDIDEQHMPDVFNIQLEDGRGPAEAKLISGGSGEVNSEAKQHDIIVEIPKGLDDVTNVGHRRLGKFEIEFDVPEGSAFDRTGSGSIIQDADKQHIYNIDSKDIYDQHYRTGIKRFEIGMELTGAVISGQGALNILIKSGEKRLALSYLALSQSDTSLNAFDDGEVSGIAALYDRDDVEDTPKTYVDIGPVIVRTT